jgi:hypothetical protein
MNIKCEKNNEIKALYQIVSVVVFAKPPGVIIVDSACLSVEGGLLARFSIHYMLFEPPKILNETLSARRTKGACGLLPISP